jgi:hypothetical protein
METECASCEVRTGLYVLLQVASISQLTVSRLSRQCGILNIAQLYRPPRPVTGIALFMETECASCEVRIGLLVLLQVANISQLTVSRLSRQCGILNIAQLYRPPRPVTGIAFFLLFLYPKDMHTATQKPGASAVYAKSGCDYQLSGIVSYFCMQNQSSVI